VGYRGHINSAGQNLDELPNVKLIDRDTAPITEELLGIVDVLITDWSSIATDFMVTGRPIVYLDRQPPREHPAPLDGADRIGEVVSDYESLVAAVIDAVANPELYQSRFSEARAVTIEKAWGKTLDGHSTDRSITAIEEVVGQGSNRSGPVH
jgi:CDP-glycerol glycerophosphotransferase (TagB/SpsB family)